MSSDRNTATIRTTVNTTVLTILSSLIFRLFKWEVSVDDLVLWSPIIAPVAAIFYRASLVLSEKLPWLGYILFGKVKPPTYR